jgi:hypothetical protein
MLQMTDARKNASRRAGMNRLYAGIALAAAIALIGAAPAAAQNLHRPFLQRDVPPTAWHYDGRDDGRDFQNNGFFPGDFAANPPAAWVGAAGIFGFTPQGGSHFSPIYCMRRYRSHDPHPGYFQGDDGIWYRCQR